MTATITPAGLRCEYLVDPKRIDVARPLLEALRIAHPADREDLTR